MSDRCWLLKVLDIGHWFAGPYASRLMADLGADVIKVEPPIGDPMRGLERRSAARRPASGRWGGSTSETPMWARSVRV